MQVTLSAINRQAMTSFGTAEKFFEFLFAA